MVREVGVVEDQPFPFKNNYCKNPLDQELILKLVLEHVGKVELDDLLDCRLVCHTWNKVAVQVLEELGYSIQLDRRKLRQFKSLLWSTRLSRSESDFTKLTSLRLSVDLYLEAEEYLEPEQDYSCEETRSKLSQLSSLLLMYPEQRVAFIDCVYYSADEGRHVLINQELFTLLKLTSQDLRSIKLNLLPGEELDRPHFEEFNFECYLALEFPRLVSINYELSSNHAGVDDGNGNQMMDLTRHIYSIMKSAPKLTKLRLQAWEGGSEGTANVSQKLLQSCSDKLKQLDFHFTDDDNGMKILSEMKFPKLTMLRLRNDIDIEIKVTKEFCQFLQYHCPVLSEFQIVSYYSVRWLLNQENNDPSASKDDMILFPSLPNIHHFGIVLDYVSVERPESLEELEGVHATFTQLFTKFPSCTSMTMNLGILVMLGAYFKNSGQLIPLQNEYAVFPNVSTLKIKNLCCQSDSLFPEMDKATTVYWHTFPNLQKLVVFVETRQFRQFLYEDSQKSSKIKGAIEFVCNHPGVQALEIQNYTKPWLDRILALGGRNTFQGIKSLKLLRPPPSSSRMVTDLAEVRAQLNLPTLLARFPSIERIQFEKAIVSGTEIQTIRNALKIMDGLKDPISKYKK